MKDNILLEKSFAFAIRVSNAAKYLIEERKEYTLSKLFLTSGTLIGAYAEEAVGGESRSDFYSKISLSYKEARRTKFWIRLLNAIGYFDDAQAESLLEDNEELLRIIGKIKVSTSNQ